MTLNQFRRGKGIISLDEKENIVVDRLADLNRRLTEAEADRIGFEAQAQIDQEPPVRFAPRGYRQSL